MSDPKLKLTREQVEVIDNGWRSWYTAALRHDWLAWEKLCAEKDKRIAELEADWRRRYDKLAHAAEGCQQQLGEARGRMAELESTPRCEECNCELQNLGEPLGESCPLCLEREYRRYAEEKVNGLKKQFADSESCARATEHDRDLRITELRGARYHAERDRAELAACQNQLAEARVYEKRGQTIIDKRSAEVEDCHRQLALLHPHGGVEGVLQRLVIAKERIADKEKQLAEVRAANVRLRDELEARRQMMRGMIPGHDCQGAEDAYEAGSEKLRAALDAGKVGA